MFVRIQQGRYRGRKIPLPPEVKKHAHFTPAVLKEAAFQLLANHCVPETTVFFDLCAGSGQMGFEAYSRDYAAVHLLEVDPTRLARLRATAADLDEGSGKFEILRRDFRRSAALIAREKSAAVFLDPPYSFWKNDDCPPVREFLRNFARKHAGSGRYVFIIQGPAGIQEPPAGELEIRRHGGHCLSLLVLSPDLPESGS